VGNSDAEGGEGDDEIDMDSALNMMEDSNLVVHDDDQAGCFTFDQTTVVFMARSS
jgi:hypothetical protein